MSGANVRNIKIGHVLDKTSIKTVKLYQGNHVILENGDDGMFLKYIDDDMSQSVVYLYNLKDPGGFPNVVTVPTNTLQYAGYNVIDPNPNIEITNEMKIKRGRRHLYLGNGVMLPNNDMAIFLKYNNDVKGLCYMYYKDRVIEGPCKSLDFPTAKAFNRYAIEVPFKRKQSGAPPPPIVSPPPPIVSPKNTKGCGGGGGGGCTIMGGKRRKRRYATRRLARR